ncbi:MAG TPA: hemolysin family protein [Sphingomonadaceae bacterium]|nr:hemolysin family protein [Sphingomonadaceae bacterium]
MPPALHPFPWLDVALIAALVALNGLLAMSELAIVSARRPRLQALAKKGRKGARTALLLASNPGKFLSTVQIGITLVGILAGAYSGASLGQPVGDRLALLGLPGPAAQQAGFALVIALTTYVSLIVGELVPKQFALRAPEQIATIVAPPMAWLSRATAPVVWLLDKSSLLVFRLLGLNRESDKHLTVEELHMIVAEASRAGVIEENERAIISGVVRLADRPVREVMTPRTEVDWINLDDSPDALRQRLIAMPHNRMPVARGSIDEIMGVVRTRDILPLLLEGAPLDLPAILRPAPVIPDQMDAMDALETLRDSAVPLALVHDEYGHFEGIVSPADLLTAIVGGFVSDREEGTDPPFVERDDGSFLIAGSYPADAMADRLGIGLPEDRDYATVAGFALAALRHLPKTGESFEAQGWRFEIADMDGRKIDKLIATMLEPPPA